MGGKDGFVGIAGVAGAAVAAIAAAAREADPQLDLLAMLPPTRSPPGVAVDAIRAEVLENARGRRMGRPPGAQNLATREAKEFFVRVFGDPLLESGRWLLHTPSTLAKELGCTILEAFDRQQRIRDALMPFLHTKLAPTGEDGRAVPVFQLVMGGVAGELEEDGLAPWLADPEIRLAIQGEQKQGVSEPAREKSHDEKSHDLLTR